MTAPRLMWALLAVALLGAASEAQAWTKRPRIPLPSGVPVSERRTVDMGSSTLEVQGYTSRLPMEELQAFYERELPKLGWTISPLAWQAQHHEATERLEQALRERPELAADPALQARLAALQRARKDLRRQLHASHGNYQMIVHLMPVGDGAIGVFLNQWEGRADTVGAPTAVPEKRWGWEQGRQQPANICCSNEPVPNSEGALPLGMPRYPGAAVIARTVDPTGKSATLMLQTPDSVEAVAAYYAKQLAYSGWKAADLDEEQQAMAEAATRSGSQYLSFRNMSHVCGIAIDPAKSGSTAMISIMPQPVAFQAGAR